MTGLMFGSSGLEVSGQPAEAAAGSDPSSQRAGTARPAAPPRGLRSNVVRSGVVAALMLTYWAAFNTLHARIGDPAFLPGLGICLLSAAWLGARGALVVIGGIALIDRSHAMALPETPETGHIAGIIALLVKLVLAGGLGLVVDSRRRARALNAELRREMAAREQSEESLRHSDRMQRALVESLGEGVGVFDAQDRVVFGNQALAETLGVAREELSDKTFSEILTEDSRRALASTRRARANAARTRSSPSTTRAPCCS
jgi:PAS domain-containing protein